MHVILADALITVQGWIPQQDIIGAYKQDVPKTPEEMQAEQALNIQKTGKKGKIQRTYKDPRNVIYHDKEDYGTVYFLPGFWPIVKQELDKKSISYTQEDHRDPRLRPPLDYSVFENVLFRKNQDVALALVETMDCGIIQTATAWGKSFCISMICKGFRSLRILVCTSSASLVKQQYDSICQQLPRKEVGILTGTYCDTEGKRVIVTTQRSLVKIPTDGPQLILVDECHDIGDNLAGETLASFRFARRFGFSASPKRNDGSQKVLYSICGPVILTMTYEESVQAGMVVPMKYTLQDCAKGFMPNENSVDDVILKKYAYWQNAYRNKVISSFVREVKAVSDGQILIIVSTLVHAIYQNMLLPEFVVAYHGAATSKQTLSRYFPKEKYPNIKQEKYQVGQKDLDRIRNAFCKGTLKYVIATSVFKQGIDATHQQVLVRADASTSDIWNVQVPGRLARLSEEKDFGYLVDINDTFNSYVKRRAQKRIQSYNDQNWTYVTRKEMQDDLRAKNKARNTESAGEQSSEVSGSGGSCEEAE